MDGLAKRLDTIEQETANQSRKWNLVTGRPDTGELDRQAKFLQILGAFFSEGELRGLALHCGIDYDALEGDGTINKSRELLKWCRRHNRLNTLYSRIQAEREFLFGED